MHQMTEISNTCEKPLCLLYSDVTKDFSGASVTGLNNNDTQIARGKVTFWFLPHDSFLFEVALWYAYDSSSGAFLHQCLPDCIIIIL